jgi:hypothetical protein
MRIPSILTLASASVLGLASAAHAECHFSPYAFFPDHNDHVTVQVVTDAKSSCGMGFKAGPGYHFTSASFAKAPPHGVLAQTGPTAFLYKSFDHYRGHDSYAVKVCADVGARHGCSTLAYEVEVQ